MNFLSQAPLPHLICNVEPTKCTYFYTISPQSHIGIASQLPASFVSPRIPLSRSNVEYAAGTLLKWTVLDDASINTYADADDSIKHVKVVDTYFVSAIINDNSQKITTKKLKRLASKLLSPKQTAFTTSPYFRRRSAVQLYRTFCSF